MTLPLKKNVKCEVYQYNDNLHNYDMISAYTE
jgi:hypothetical protein